MQGIGPDVWRYRAVACELLALGLRYPNETLAAAIREGGFAETASEIGEFFGFESVFEEEERDGSVLLEALKKEHTRLFIGPAEPLVDAYECVWDARSRNAKPLLFIGPKALEVEAFCKSCGIGRPEGTNEPMDHIATELELLEYLASLGAGIAVLPSGLNPCDFPGGSPEEAYGIFYREHLAKWGFDFASALKQNASEPFYGALAAMLAALLGSEGFSVRR
ncbi:TorD/DmsD family molecular chaperone [Slackia piriformis]|uniref:TorD/DmsD family molecular chaperone n=1 Tax=Slackia piriformis TaxID=626934 RepID=UPI0026DCCFA2|nr:molecular chaperone TorD family protein [Slackia piriformis]MDO5024674.1 molecular chaperone TorD family protein [Slackia piriformis]